MVIIRTAISRKQFDEEVFEIEFFEYFIICTDSYCCSHGEENCRGEGETAIPDVRTLLTDKVIQYSTMHGQ